MKIQHIRRPTTTLPFCGSPADKEHPADTEVDLSTPVLRVCSACYGLMVKKVSRDGAVASRMVDAVIQTVMKVRRTHDIAEVASELYPEDKYLTGVHEGLCTTMGVLKDDLDPVLDAAKCALMEEAEETRA